MARVEVVKAKQEHIDFLKGNFRADDIKECWDTSHSNVDEAAQKGFETSNLCWVVLLDSKPICVFGVAAMSMLGYVGVPWLLGTEDVKKVKIKFIRQSKKYIKQMFEGFGMLENYVAVSNQLSVLWLKWCGFILDEAKPYGVENQLFHRFWLEKEVG